MKKMSRFEKKQIFEKYKNSLSQKSLGVNQDVLEWAKVLKTLLYEQIVGFVEQLKTDNDFYSKTLKEIDDVDDKIYVNTVKLFLDEKLMTEYLSDKISNTNKIKLIDLNIDFILTTIEDYDSKYVNAYFNDTYANLDSNDNLVNSELFYDFYLPYEYLELDTNNIETLTNFLIEYDNIDKDTESKFVHELTHTLEFYERRKNGTRDFKENLINYLINTYKDNSIVDISHDWLNFLNYIYLDLSFERNARISQLYTLIKKENIKTQDNFFSEVKKTEVWADMIQLKEFNAQDFYDNFQINSSDDDINDVLSEYEGSVKEKVFKMLLSRWNIIVKLINNENDNNIKLEKINNYYLNNPLKFLKYWENKFHNDWDDFKLRVDRLYSRL